MPASLYDRLLARPKVAPGALTLPPPEIVAFNVHVTRKLHGWKQATLAEIAGVSLSTVERIERGEPVQPAALEKIGACFGCPAGYYTKPRRTLTAEQMATDTYAHTAFVEVAPLKTQPQVRRLAACAELAVAPFGDVSVDDPLCSDLVELILDLEVRFALPRYIPKSKLDGVRPLYEAIFAHLQIMRRAGLDVVAGVLHEPERDPATYGVIAVARRATHPGLHARKLLVLDRRQVTGHPADEDAA